MARALAKKASAPAVVYLGLGSNVEAEKNLSMAMRELRRRYGELEASAVYQSAALGFEGDDFLNLVVRLRSNRTALELCQDIELIHNLAGRERGSNKWAARPLDIDLLLYNDAIIDEPPVKVPRNDVLAYSFVLRPLAELAPDLTHPVTGTTMEEHWQMFDAGSHPLEIVGVVM